MTTVVVATGTLGTRATNSRYPEDEGLTMGTQKQNTDSPHLEPEINLAGTV